MGFIYKITNDINNKGYIGLTFKEDPFERWKKHISDYQYMTKYSKRPLYIAMQKYGIQHFHFQVLIEQEDEEKLKELEKYYINLYNTYLNGYNATLGGDGHQQISLDQKKEIVSLYQKGQSINSLAKTFNHRTTTISNILQEFNCKQRDDFKPKKVLQLNKQTGQVLNQFNSFLQAAKFLNKTGNGGHISEVCSGKRKSAYGYFWKLI